VERHSGWLRATSETAPFPRLFAVEIPARVTANAREELLGGMTEPSTTAHDFPAMHVKPSGGHAGLAALPHGLAIDPMIATLLQAVTALVQPARRRQSR
jgi:hypothetical protein